MRTNSAIPIVQQKRGALVYKYHCGTNSYLLSIAQTNFETKKNYAKELEYNNNTLSNKIFNNNEIINRMKYYTIWLYVVRTSLSFFIVCSASASAAGYNNV